MHVAALLGNSGQTDMGKFVRCNKTKLMFLEHITCVQSARTCSFSVLHVQGYMDCICWTYYTSHSQIYRLSEKCRKQLMLHYT